MLFGITTLPPFTALRSAREFYKDWRAGEDLSTHGKYRRETSTEPLPPILPPRKRRLNVQSSEQEIRALAAQVNCGFMQRLPSEIRQMIYAELICNMNIIVGLQHVYATTWRRPYRELLFHRVVSKTDRSDHWKKCAADSDFWPAGRLESAHHFLPLLMTCRFIYSEAIQLLYRTNTFLFKDPRDLLQFRRMLPQVRVEDITAVYLKWSFSVTYFAHHCRREKRLWRDMWRCLEGLSALQTLKVTIEAGYPHNTDGWLKDLSWLEPVKRVTTPQDSELLMPVAVPQIELDTSPSACRLRPHPLISAPQHVSERDHQHWEQVKHLWGY